MDQQTLRQFEANCVQDEPPACQTMCPIHLDGRTLANLVAEDKLKDARKLIDRYLPLSCLTAYLCEGPCQTHCRRSELDQGLDLPLLERYCVSQASGVKPMALPANGKKMATLGAGLSSLVLAWEMGKKGYQVTVYHVGTIGGRLSQCPPPLLPAGALGEALELLAKVRVVFEPWSAYSPDNFKQALAENQAIFLGFDDPALTPEAIGLTPTEAEVTPVIMATSRENVYACPLGVPARFIEELTAAKKAAGSMDRVSQGGSASSAREAEQVYPTRLFTNLEGEVIKPKQVLADPLTPTAAEVQTEASRCLNCRCLECVKKCAFLAHYQGYPKKFAREIYNNITTAYGIRTSNTMILSCAQCGLCAEICPNGVNMGQFTAISRLAMTTGNHMPISAHEFALEDQEFSNSPEVSFCRPQPGQEQSEWLFFPGCQLPASQPQTVSAVYDHLRNHLAGGVGFMLACCGAPSLWAGRPQRAARTLAAIKTAWEKAGQPKIITACASCCLFFQKELPEITTISLWSILASLPLPEKATGGGPPLALHDPCTARHDDATQNGVRKLLTQMGQEYQDPPSSGHLTLCCGYGGLASTANPDLGHQYAQKRLKDNDQTWLAYCIMCRDRLRAEGRPTLHILDLLFPLANPKEAAARPVPCISDRQENRLKFSRDLLKKLWGETPAEDDLMNNDLTIHIGEETALKMESRRILRSDVKNVLREAQQNGPIFSNPATGHHLACFRPRQVTFWVEYSLDDGSFEIHDAYCHRMSIPGTPGPGADSVACLEGFNPKGNRI